MRCEAPARALLVVEQRQHRRTREGVGDRRERPLGAAKHEQIVVHERNGADTAVVSLVRDQVSAKRIRPPPGRRRGRATLRGPATIRRVRDVVLRICGWRLLFIQGDTAVLDRWLWLRRRLRDGPLRTFDAGCGNGAFSIYAATRGNDVLAASFSAEEQQTARRRADALGIDGVEFRLLDLRDLEQARASLGAFDQIICLETIEHLRDDAGLLSSLALMLAPGGQLLLTTPFQGHRPLHTEDPHPSGVEDGSHVRYGYTQQEIARLAEQAGLRVLEQSFVTGVVSQKLIDLMRRLTARFGLLPAWLAVLPLRALVVLDRPLSAILGYPYLCVALRAERPAA
jgi:2-polyprenyl-3-methyl-5-hydroxy-6-metoxy-1,4-benzoquinol methylase